MKIILLLLICNINSKIITIINLKHNHTNVNYQTGKKWLYVQSICNKVNIIIRKNKNLIKKTEKRLKNCYYTPL